MSEDTTAARIRAHQIVALWWGRIIHHKPIEGLRVRPSRLRAVSVALLPLVFLAACGSAKTDTPASALDSITVGGTDKAPTVTVKSKPLSVNVTTTNIIPAGTGPKLPKENLIRVHH